MVPIKACQDFIMDKTNLWVDLDSGTIYLNCCIVNTLYVWISMSMREREDIYRMFNNNIPYGRWMISLKCAHIKFNFSCSNGLLLCVACTIVKEWYQGFYILTWCKFVLNLKNPFNLIKKITMDDNSHTVQLKH